ncbi:ubiquitin carboxyl-terminal hydrolase 20-like isoform X1 [Dreissena polymorpha]|uniref:ubiquitin carboxyl-terminal hydrolase 20-like isoform X1 n=2 Tax=Dreissena polymorpha TaxID=45954 RepID=UPI0022647B76|nr:ubiquitin carboxyl-terminal hydrolase 20-like isoform X1 [Dreissena polymorpha]XP_052228366.1 ubiquitin carboxyl-terminal hydrolase 20-like isoform X1 [Dreissena polymorpha]XP_052228367.1 ubiquitin carboxyl-terminal hydrolase 20-like isoform X1 [Dreissena polymorpha]XP_052228368.1 ubiquitin carboxyl-terminal hydrolase 20-like isoform X1 [Dreissena polymorpha]
MTGKESRCNHVLGIRHVSWEQIRQAQKHEKCDSCNVTDRNLWLCLIGRCSYVGCGESTNDHSSHHADTQAHCLAINLTTQRIWCYNCEMEVYHTKNYPPFIIPEQLAPATGQEIGEELSPESYPQHGVLGGSPQYGPFGGDDSDTEAEDENAGGGHHGKPRGLTGLQNLGNTCYLNAALQALSNCPPLTRFFLDCPGFVHPEKTPKLSMNYMKLMLEMWHKKRPSYLVPSSVVNGIKTVHPMFRGYSQQDTQEFLRCFMDQLHEELKQPIIKETDDQEEGPSIHESSSSPVIGQRNPDKPFQLDTSSSSSQSDYEYETCDSALGSEKDFIDPNELTDEEQLSEMSKLNLSSSSPRELGKQRKSKSKLSKMNDGKNGSFKDLKDFKDAANKSMKNMADNTSVGSEDQKSDPGDYVDAEADPMKSRRHLRTTSGSSDRDLNVKSAKFKQAGGFKTARGPGKTVHYRSVISDVFDGKLNSSVQCLTCERVSTTKETFQDLSLPIPSKDHLHMIHTSSVHGPGTKTGACSEVHQGWFHSMLGWMRSWFLGPMITLQDCLAAFFSADELKGDNMYSCEKCKKLRNGLKFSKVLELPEVLCIHLKRFRHEFYSSKISTYVTFPLANLEMKHYLHKEHSNAVTTYDLLAVICHHGSAGDEHYSGGHYTAYCQNVVTEQWYEYDDQYVTEVDVSQVINCEAYVLFYRKQNDHMNSIRQKAEELMMKREPSLMHFFISKQWINRFNTFAEPGPITNQDFLCQHGGVPPQKVEYIADLVLPVSQAMWRFLHDRFGGGPSCNHLFACTQCQKQQQQLRSRQKGELDQFIQLNDQFKEEDNPSVIYAISMTWFKDWENFVREKDDSPPGPIDNKRISIVKNGQVVVRPNSDHGQLSGAMWQYLFGIYGGGPELIVKQVTPPTMRKTLAEQAQSAASWVNKTENAHLMESGSNVSHPIEHKFGCSDGVVELAESRSSSEVETTDMQNVNGMEERVEGESGEVKVGRDDKEDESEELLETVSGVLSCSNDIPEQKLHRD